MITFKKYLTERKLEKFFFLVTDLPTFRLNDKQWDDVRRGVLTGVSGISDNTDIVLHFLGVARNAMFVMNKQEVMRLNDVESLQYDDAEAMLANDMAKIRRVFAKGPGHTQATLMNILTYMGMYIQRDLGDRAPYYMEWEAVFAQRAGWLIEKNSLRINSVKDLEKAIEKCLDMENQTWSFQPHQRDNFKELLYKYGIKKLIHGAFKKVNDIYGSEGEWVVHGGQFKVPPKSRLVVLVHPDLYNAINNATPAFRAFNPNIEKKEQWLKQVDELRSIYDLRIVDAAKFDKRRLEVITR